MTLRTSTSRRSQRAEKRRGTTIVETAVVLPIFFTMIMGIIEFGHCFMTIHTMNSAARRAARAGVPEAATTAQIKTMAHAILDSAIDADNANVKILVKDASAFDQAGFDASNVDYTALPDTNVENLESGQLFVVRVQVPYSEIGILGPRWIKTLDLYGQSVMRKE